MKWVSVLALAALASCGVEGPPTAPPATNAGVSVSGDARVGVVGKF